MFEPIYRGVDKSKHYAIVNVIMFHHMKFLSGIQARSYFRYNFLGSQSILQFYCSDILVNDMVTI